MRGAKLRMETTYAGLTCTITDIYAFGNVSENAFLILSKDSVGTTLRLSTIQLTIFMRPMRYLSLILFTLRSLRVRACILDQICVISYEEGK